MGGCCSGEGDADKEQNMDDSSGGRRGRVTSDQARSKYLREKLKERKPLLPPLDKQNKDRPQAVGHSAVSDPREAAHIRHEKLIDAELATEKMKSSASKWKQTAAALASAR